MNHSRLVEEKTWRHIATGNGLKQWLLVLLTGLLLLPAIVNGGPIWFPDSVEYLSVGERFWQTVVHGTHFDFYGQRSILYSAVLFLVHWNTSSWPVIVLHAVLVSTNSVLALRALHPQITNRTSWGTVLTTILTTGVSVYVCFLMPDVLAGVMVLAMVTLLRAGRSLSSPVYAWVAISLWYGIVSHGANVLLSFGAVGCYCGIAYWYREKLEMAAIVSVVCVQCIAVVSLVIIHADLYGKFSLQNPRQPVFAMARILADEPGNTYFRQNHKNLPWHVCRYSKDMPKDAGAILWGQPGIWNRSETERQQLKSEESSVVRTIVFSDPLRQMRSSVWNVWRLVLSPVDYRILRSQTVVTRLIVALPFMQSEYLNSRQANQRLSLATLRAFHEVGYWLTVLGTLILFLMNRFRFQIAFFSSVILLNAAIAGTLSGPMPRYHERLTWVLTLVAIAAFMQWWKTWKTWRDQRVMQVQREDSPVLGVSA
jgi:hypothetical protein